MLADCKAKQPQLDLQPLHGTSDLSLCLCQCLFTLFFYNVFCLCIFMTRCLTMVYSDSDAVYNFTKTVHIFECS